ncbi:MAG: F0F1 ATP synthase subunit A [Archangium sp.]|nr:F0F1 ATP synthase subunit A [Archangium sp.]
MSNVSRVLGLLVCLAPFVAFSNEAAEGHQPTPNEFIAHHVADSYDWELEYPSLLTKFGVHLPSPAIHLGHMFSFLKFERVEGACALPVGPAYLSVPPIGKLVNGCFDMRPSKAHLMMFFAGVLVLILGFSFGNRKKEALVPVGRGQNLWEAFVQFIRDEIAIKNIGAEEGEKYVPFLASLFIFILAMNWLGLVPGFFSATGSMVITGGLAICTFVVSQYAAIRSAGIGGYLAHLTGGMSAMVMTGPIPMRFMFFLLMLLFIPIEIVGLLVKPFVLTMRLFANMFAGHMVLFSVLALAVVSGGLWYGFSFAIGTVIYLFETFVGLLQAFLFTLLSSIYIGLSVQMGHHDHGEGHDAAHH